MCVFYTVSVRVCLTPSRKGPQQLEHCVQSITKAGHPGAKACDGRW